MRLCAVVSALAFAAGLAGQTVEGIPDMARPLGSGESCADNDCILTVEQFLERHGYALTPEDLVSALRDPAPEVRSLAAAKLAKDQLKSAVPALGEAFSIERAPGTQMWMASGLATLGDARGLPTLERLCKDDDDPDPLHRAAVRSFAAGFMVGLHSKACNDDAIQVLQFRASLPATAVQGAFLDVDFSLAGNLEGASERQSKEIRDIAERFLADGRYDVRMGASNVLARFGDAGSARLLKKSLAAEPDVTVRARMQAALDQLDR